MESSQYNVLSSVCAGCKLDGGCCHGAMPPLTQRRIEALIESGVSPENIDLNRYKKLKLKDDGYCVLFKDGQCSIHTIKPETCVAGPFTFDVKGSVLEIFLKKESICPLAGYIRTDKSLYDGLFELSVQKIVELLDGLPSDELKEILKIEEPDTEIVAEIKLKRVYL
jgi:uncharacterized protein